MIFDQDAVFHGETPIIPAEVTTVAQRKYGQIRPAFLYRQRGSQTETFIVKLPGRHLPFTPGPIADAGMVQLQGPLETGLFAQGIKTGLVNLWFLGTDRVRLVQVIGRQETVITRLLCQFSQQFVCVLRVADQQVRPRIPIAPACIVPQIRRHARNNQDNLTPIFRGKAKSDPPFE